MKKIGLLAVILLTSPVFAATHNGHNIDKKAFPCHGTELIQHDGKSSESTTFSSKCIFNGYEVNIKDVEYGEHAILNNTKISSHFSARVNDWYTKAVYFDVDVDFSPNNFSLH